MKRIFHSIFRTHNMERKKIQNQVRQSFKLKEWDSHACGENRQIIMKG